MFTKDSRTENFLTQMGVEFRYTNRMLFSDLRIGWEKDNLARPVPQREDAILEYAALMEGGSAAPSPILQDGGQYSVLDGVQRLSAAKLCGTTQFPAYVVTCDSDDIIAAIRVLANARLQGRAEPAEWTRRRAVEVLVVERGLSVEEVARMGGWKPADINRLANTIHWAGLVRCAGGPDLPDNMLESVGTHLSEAELLAAPEPIAEFLTALKLAKFSTADAEPFIKEFFRPVTKPAKRHRIYMDRLEDFKQQPEVETRLHGRRVTPLRRDVVLLRSLKSVVTVLDEIIADRDDVPFVDEYFRLLKVIHKKLKAISPHQTAVKAAVPADMWSKHE